MPPTILAVQLRGLQRRGTRYGQCTGVNAPGGSLNVVMKPAGAAEQAGAKPESDASSPVAGEASKPGECLLADARYMDSRTAETVSKWVESWQSMSQEQFEHLAQKL
jgi:hypothetical protein